MIKRGAKEGHNLEIFQTINNYSSKPDKIMIFAILNCIYVFIQ